ncbi:hypothetical protein F5Y13DRAFT_54322 [Hypoxylon sp. FL1857]|nr:hypothetical protein F5Y13DRAFT_54322 [Hypoxylon sp. FL1857]
MEDAIRMIWPSGVDGMDSVKQLIQSRSISQVVSRRSIETLVARAEENSNGAKAVATAFLVLQLIVVIAILVTLDYTLDKIFPVLAMIEDEAPPSYAAVGSKEAEELEDLAGNKDAPVDDDPSPRPKPITRSLRSIYRHVRSISGKKSLFRGFICWVVYNITLIPITLLLVSIPFIPVFVAAPIATLLTAPLYTAWVHIVITKPSEKYFWHRIPRFGLVFRATALPTLILGIVDGVKDKLYSGMVNWGPLGTYAHEDNSVPTFLLKSALALLIWIFVQIPLEVALTRVQASMLPKEDETIVPLDHALTLHKDEGKEYVSLLDAWKSFSRGAWVRLMNVYAMTIMICVMVYVVLGCIAVAEFMLMPFIFNSSGNAQ